MPVLKFPEGFLWGAATASYQIEGSPLADGAGESIWHRFSHTPGKIDHGHNADKTCDHYNRWQEDVALMRELGLKAYRFSIAWPRIFPQGRGAMNRPGLDFYDRLVDALLEADIQPMATLYHWDLPQALQDRGGWADPDTVGRYADYAETIFSALGDRVQRFVTFNEPWVFVWLGHALGLHAPGLCDVATALRAGHNVLLAHGAAVERFRAASPPSEIGITLSIQAVMPEDDASEDDRDAAERYGAFLNTWFADPLLLGEYPQPIRDQFGERLPAIDDAARAQMQRPIDFIGVNYYERSVVRHEAGNFFKTNRIRPLGQIGGMEWEVYPAGLYHVLTDLHRRYDLPLLVTENGFASETEQPDAKGFVEDDDRLRFLQSHFEMAHRALSEGVNLRGYLVWSLLDNFEWSFGFGERFGLIRCDYETLQRVPKKSAQWYARVIAENGI